jgi:WhiB family redox-sensing transcriptional regulator
LFNLREELELMLTLIPSDPDATWHDAAACAQTDPDAFFPERGDSDDAQKVCRTCAVRANCLADALDRDEEFGIWGGLGPKSRRKARCLLAAGRTIDEVFAIADTPQTAIARAAA